jgi:hypothetical protein
MVRNELAQLPAARQEEFVEEYRRKAKSQGTAYAIWFLLGWQYAYLGKWGFQVLYWLTAGGLLMWAIADLFRIPAMVRDFNKDVATDVLRSLKTVTSA